MTENKVTIYYSTTFYTSVSNLNNCIEVSVHCSADYLMQWKSVIKSLASYKKAAVNDSSGSTINSHVLYKVQLFSNMKCLSDNFSIIMNNFENPCSSLTAVGAASMYHVWYLQFVFSQWHSELEVLVASKWQYNVKSLSQRTSETKVKQFLWMSILPPTCYHLTSCQSSSISCLSLTVTGTAPHPSSS